jgi:LCP family protein required for cell wall assembly
MATTRKRNSSRIRLPLWALGLVVLLVLVLVGASGFWLFDTIRSQVANWELTDPEFATNSQTTDATRVPDDDEMPDPIASEIRPILSTDSLKPWQGTERVTILLLGIDQRCDEEGPTRTDSLMVLTMDPVGLSAGALSLPRDMWVEIPGFDVDKINQAHFLGEINEYPGGGPALAVETVEATLGIEIDYYATVNFDGFREAIDLIGGITVSTPVDIEDPDYPDNCYGYEGFYLAEGEHHLDGEQALKFARTRVTEGSDIDRAARQQMVLLAVRDRILDANMLPQLMLEAPQLWQTFQDSTRTNMSINEAAQLALLARNIPRESIRTAVLDYDYVAPYTRPDGQQVLVPDREAIRVLRDTIFRPPAVPTPVIENLGMLVTQEAATVRVINGTQVFGLAAETQSYLQDHSVNVIEIGNADASTYRTTQIIDYSGKQYTSLYLTQVMSLPPLNISTGSDPEGEYDILVILGSDWEIPEDD